ncbi:cation/calcium exchanger 1-like [Lolium perenne]|uniref:cation/calcium exchanger 1-like n=1 Tax=Lolium perenne TaxID=4522 RepID=UPI003A99B5B2
MVELSVFVRDLCFLFFALCFLVAVLATGTVTVWVAAAFVSLYAAYVILVWTSQCCAGASAGKPDLAEPLLLDGDAPTMPSHSAKPTDPAKKSRLQRVLHALTMPLYLPRRLTIPDIAGHRWRKPYAVASAALAPVLVATTFTSRSAAVASLDHGHGVGILLASAFLGLLLAALAASTTDAGSAPRSRRHRVPWLAAGFLMSVLWAYTLARELVALLVAIGYMVGVDSGVLGVTVLAWGDSLGDLVSNVAMAMHGGPGGAQTAVSTCYVAYLLHYVGPLFNTVVGLGLSLTLVAGAQYPAPFTIPTDGAVYETVAFLFAGLQGREKERTWGRGCSDPGADGGDVVAEMGEERVGAAGEGEGANVEERTWKLRLANGWE